jgi:Flp pilus assembly protein TadD
MSLSRDQRHSSATEMRKALRAAGKEVEEQANRARMAELYQVAQSAMKNEEWSKAVEHLQLIQELNSSYMESEALLHQARQQQHLSSIYNEGRKRLESDQLHEALESFRQIESIQSNYKDTPALIEKIQIRIDEQEAESLYAITLEYIARKQWMLAIKRLQHVLNLNPSHAEAKLKLDYARQQQDLTNLYHAALSHHEDGRWREAHDDLGSIKQIDENYRDIAERIKDCRNKIEEQRLAALSSKIEEATSYTNQPTVKRQLQATDLSGAAEAPAGLNKPLPKKDTLQQQQKRQRSKRLFGIAALWIVVIATAVTVTLISNRQANTIKAAKQQYEIGAKLVDEQKYGEAEVALREAVRLNPNDTLAHSKLGDALSGLNKDAEAEAEYREVIRLIPNNATAHNSLGVLLAGQKKDAEAEAEYREAIRLDPNDYLAHNNLGSILSNQKKYDEAEAQLRESIRLNPNYDYAHVNLGEIFTYQKKYTEAEAEFREAIRNNPYYARAHYNLGSVLAGQAKFDEAEAALSEAIRLDPNDANAHLHLGNALAFQKKYAKAESEFSEAKRLSPDSALAHFYLGLSLAYQQKHAGAEVEFREAIRLDPSIADHHFYLGISLASQGKYAEAKVEVEEALRLDPANSRYQQFSKVIKGRR